ncbi:MAG: DinB family protein [Anaerolineaceae bacterium]
MDGIFVQAVSVISTTAARWEQMARDIPAELFSRKPTPEEWSAQECLIHMIDTERVFKSRLEAFLRGDETLPAFDPDAEGTKMKGSVTPLQLTLDFSVKRSAGLTALKMLKPSDLERTSHHAELGLVTLRQMVNEWAAHDLNHTMQAERAMMQPFIDGCGSWVVYFKQHRY